MKKTPRVTIVGFPNVGKSTLFNRLLKKKKALVHSQPGMTRDQVAASCTLGAKPFTLVDTGGLFDSQHDPFSEQIRRKAWEASQEADVLIFLLDGKRELLPAEEELYTLLKRLNKPMLVVVNKVDSIGEEDRIGDFFRLGGEPLLVISAEHKRNLEELETRVADLLPEGKRGIQEEAPLKIALVGRTNVGKSSLVNLLSGQEKLIVSEIPGTTRDSTDTLIYRNKKAFCLVDTAGIRKLSRTRDKREKASIIKAKKDITRADVICLIMDAQEFPTRQDTAIAHLARDSGKPLLLALNKWDLVEKNTQTAEEYKIRAFDKLEFISYAPLLTISALSGRRVIKILDAAERVFANGGRRISTSRLNTFLRWLSEEHPPVSRKKRTMKIKYITQKDIYPPTFLIFTHSRMFLAPAYEKHMESLLRKTFHLEGNPIRILLRRN